MTDIKVENNKIDLAQFAPRRNFSVPNLLSLVRLVLLPVIVWAYFQHRTGLATLLILVSSLSDFADGYIARRFNQVTTLGRVLDPLADKLTQFTLAVCLTLANPVLIPLAVVLAVKELWMLSWGLRLLRSNQQPFNSCWWGKLSTAAFYVAAVIMVFFEEELGGGASALISSLVTLLLLYSTYRYGMLFGEKIRSAKELS